VGYPATQPDCLAVSSRNEPCFSLTDAIFIISFKPRSRRRRGGGGGRRRRRRGGGEEEEKYKFKNGT
jgi:hypothetical protein